MCEGAVTAAPPEQAEAVCASAPGKLILFGEHAVVYGQPAVAAALSDLRIHVLLEQFSSSSSSSNNSTKDGATIRICMPDLPTPIDCHVGAQALFDRRRRLQAPPTPACAALLERMLLDDPYFNNTVEDDKDNSFTVHAILPVLYLLSQLCPPEILVGAAAGCCCKVTVRSQDLPVGAGLGSSAAFGVACAAALIQWKLRYSDRSNAFVKLTSSPITPNKDLIEQINRYAYYSEILLHGRPSGIDNTVAAHGGAWRFQRTHHETSEEAIDLCLHHHGGDLRILLVHTGVPRQTKQLVARVRHLYDQHPAIVTPMLQAMGAIATTFCETVASKRSNNTYNNDNDTLLTLVRTNQQLLCALGVSHDSLDRICATVQRVAPHTAAAKLTGAGGGGCALVLLLLRGVNDDTVLQEEEEQQLIQAIRTSAAPDYHCSFFSSRVGGEGVLFVPPVDFPDYGNTNNKNCRASGSSIVKSMQHLLEPFVASATWKLSLVVGAAVVATGISATIGSRRRNY